MRPPPCNRYLDSYRADECVRRPRSLDPCRLAAGAPALVTGARALPCAITRALPCRDALLCRRLLNSAARNRSDSDVKHERLQDPGRKSKLPQLNPQKLAQIDRAQAAHPDLGGRWIF